ncbi:reverse transcriptase [Lasius niger]|uniref:Reverse transcriptase n=1 Tax=Lasius niger TaxID=67767 RepID=A0A0J7KF37_LASNI|nr:reverse transcriptase [Lasius niger]
MRCGDIHIISCYISPNATRSEFLSFLDELGLSVRILESRILIGGDFNSKSTLWGSPFTNSRGELLEEWAAELDLRLVNTGNLPTCIRPQGQSIIDLTWSTADINNLIENWRVANEIETLSDHEYILITIGHGNRVETTYSRRRPKYPRWKWKNFDLDKFRAALIWSCSVSLNEDGNELVTPDLRERKVRLAMRDACDAATTRAGGRFAKTQAYWWSEEISQLRKTTIQKKRAWTHAKQRRRPADQVDNLWSLYKSRKKKLLRNAINRAKMTAWQELLDTIEDDPWGLPYKLVLKKLRHSTPSLTETLDEETVDSLIGSLFPNGAVHDPLTLWPEPMDWDVTWDILPEEVDEAIKRKAANNAAPGPDGIKANILARVPCEMAPVIEGLYNVCLRAGIFPKEWKRAKLTLIPKGETSQDGEIPKARPICLLDETGKILERIIVNRLTKWMDDNPTHQLSNNQYGFREGRSTCDALSRVQDFIDEAVEQNGVVVAIGIDIANAFNSLPWPAIRRAMEKKEFPEYLRRMIDGYLFERTIEHTDRRGNIRITWMRAGVPQGSVLGPTLWNIGYDCILQEGAEEGCQIICYADDTLVLATADTVERATARANLQVNLVVNRIKRLGLKVSASKTEAVLFRGPRRKIGNFPVVTVDGEFVQVGTSMKYLGVMLDSRMTFQTHFEYIEGKMSKVARALGRLMPNLRGPGEIKRRLYANVILSIVLYAAPIWCDALTSARRNREKLDRLMKVMNICVISAYRTVSLEASSILARIPPLHLLAATRRRVYLRTTDLRNSGQWTKESANAIREAETLIMTRQWEIHLRKPLLAGARTRDAILPSLALWLSREHGGITFHATQLLTGHGCFASYLHRIGKVASPVCEHCDYNQEDTAEHTL